MKKLVRDRTLIGRPASRHRVMIGAGQMGVGQRLVEHAIQRPSVDAVEALALLLGDEGAIRHHGLPVHAGGGFVLADFSIPAACVCAAQNAVLLQLGKVEEVI